MVNRMATAIIMVIRMAIINMAIRMATASIMAITRMATMGMGRLCRPMATPLVCPR